MMRAWRALALGAVLAMGQGASSTPVPQAQWPQAAREAFAEWQQDCRSSGGRLSAAADYVRTGDFNADGRPDYLIDDSALTCNGGSAGICSAVGNCGVVLLVSSGPGGRLVDTAESGDGGWMGTGSEIVREGGRDFVSLASRHGTAAILGWDGRTMREMNAAERRRLGPAPSAATSGAAAGRASSARWILRDGVASVQGVPGPVAEMATSCVPGGAALVIQLDRAAEQQIDVTLSAGGATERLRMTRAGESLVWFAQAVQGPVLAMISGTASEVRVTAGGLSGTVPLGGSGEAVRGALAECWSPGARGGR